MKQLSAIIVLGVVLLFAACNKVELRTEKTQISKSLSLDIIISYPEETKATKWCWETGDKIFLFFNGVTTGYVTISYDGTAWGSVSMIGITVEDLSETGSTLTAVFLPYGTDAVATFNPANGRWTFDKAWDTYYLYASKQSYTVSIVDGIATLSAVLNMNKPNGFIQFFIPDENATGTALMSCNNLYYSGVSYISSDGTITQLSMNSRDNSSGYFIRGYAATVSGAKGYYFSGKFWTFNSDAIAKQYYYFALEKDGKYYDFCKRLSSDMSSGMAVQLSSMNQVGEGYYTANTLGGSTWATVNYGATKPWEYDTPEFVWPGADLTAWESVGLTELESRSESVPTYEQFQSLFSSCNKYRTEAGGKIGYLFIDRNTGGYMFLPCTKQEGRDGHYWSSTEYSDSEGYYLFSNTWTIPYSLHTSKTSYRPIRAVKN